jgi:murein L,D-transpeptidase YafK
MNKWQRRILVLVLPAVLLMQTTGQAARIESNGAGPIPEVLIPFAPEQQETHVIVVEKESQTLSLYSNNGSYAKVFSTRCSTGEKPGAKTRNGDKKTPEGIYFFTQEFHDKDLAPVYGTRAFPIDYPNVLDRRAGRDGYAIWLHGTNKPLKERDTNGCIVLENQDIDRLAGYIRLNRTPLIIVNRLTYTSDHPIGVPDPAVLKLAAAWHQALSRGDLDGYRSLYDMAHRPDTSWWPTWTKALAHYRRHGQELSLKAKNTVLFRHNGILVVLFDQFLTAPGGRLPVGTKKLYLQHRNHALQIVAEEYLWLSDRLHHREGSHPLVALTRQAVLAPALSEAEIRSLVKGWATAWSAKDIDLYAGYYAQEFRSRGMNRSRWIQYKNRLNRQYKYIKVNYEGLRIRLGESRATVSFVQHYESDRYRAVGQKWLVLKREEGQWKILRETWKKR